MPRRIGHDELALLGVEVPVGDVDRDPLLTLCSQTIKQEREVKLSALGTGLLGLGLEGGQMVLEQELGLVEQPSDERALAVVDAATCDEAQKAFVLLCVQVGSEIRMERLTDRHPK